MRVQKLVKLVKLSYMVCKAAQQALKCKAIRKRRWWVRELNLTRDIDGYFAQSYQKLKTRDPEHFFKVTRMKSATFELLLTLIGEQLEKASIRKAIVSECRLFLTLMYLSQGVPMQVLGWMFKMGVSTVRKIIYETCDIIWNCLWTIYMSPPSTYEWRKIAEDYENIWNLPNCVSSVDGKHINIQCPQNAGSKYFNYKGQHSIVLLAACDANYTFTAVDIGAYGSQSDGGIFAQSSFGKKLLSGTLNLPGSTVLRNSKFLCPHYFIGDAAFPLKTFLLRPYPGKLLSEKRTNFNYRLSRARRVIENAFGVLTARWRVLVNKLHMLPSNAEKIVKAAVLLHNFVKMHDSNYCPREFVDYEEDGTIVEGLWRQEVKTLPDCRRFSSNFPPKNAVEMRDALKEYLFNDKLNKKTF